MKSIIKANKFSKKNKIKYTFIICMLAFPMAQFAVFYIYMNFSNIILAFQGMHTDYSTYWNGLNNFKLLFQGTESNIFSISLKNNIIMFCITLILGLPLNLLFSYYLYKKRFGSKIIRIIYMLPSMVSGIVMTLLFMKFMEVALPQLFSEYFGADIPNLIRNNNSAFGVQIFYALWLGFSSSLIIYSNAMFAIDDEIIEAGKIDGTKSFTEFCYIIVPLIFPTISTYMITGTAGILTISGSLFLFYGLTGVPINTYLMGFYLFKIAMAGDLTTYPVASAASLCITVVTVPITLLVRWFMNRIDPMKDNYQDIC